jgi:hypothetical protein
MKFPIRTLAVTLVFAAAATTADAQSGAQNGTSRGPNSSFYYGRNLPNTPRADPVNAPTNAANPLTRPVGRFGPVTAVPEPGEWAMLLAGLALVGFIVRRNSKRS